MDYNVMQAGTMHAVTVLLALMGISSCVDGHGRLMDPPARNSMWRLGFNNPVNYNDNELYCGGRMVQWLRNGGKCGVCGDAFHGVREHEAGGRYANGIIARTYRQGENMPITVHLTANHQGWFEIRICPVEDPKLPVTQECLDKHVLKRTDDNSIQYPVPKGKYNAFFNYSVQLPPHLYCDQCVVQWKYRTGNTWDKDDNSGVFCLGCGPQEEFYNCADIRILPNESKNYLKEINTQTTAKTHSQYTEIEPTPTFPVKMTQKIIDKISFSGHFKKGSMIENSDLQPRPSGEIYSWRAASPVLWPFKPPREAFVSTPGTSMSTSTGHTVSTNGRQETYQHFRLTEESTTSSPTWLTKIVDAKQEFIDEEVNHENLISVPDNEQRFRPQLWRHLRKNAESLDRQDVKAISDYRDDSSVKIRYENKSPSQSTRPLKMTPTCITVKSEDKTSADDDQLGNQNWIFPDTTRWWRDYVRIYDLVLRPRLSFMGNLRCRAALHHGSGMDEWCTANCNANFCPHDICVCRPVDESYDELSSEPFVDQRSAQWMKSIYPQRSKKNTPRADLSFSQEGDIKESLRKPHSGSQKKQTYERLLQDKKPDPMVLLNIKKSQSESTQNKMSVDRWERKLGTVCHATGRYATLDGYDDWCQNNCARAMCPLFICQCKSD